MKYVLAMPVQMTLVVFRFILVLVSPSQVIQSDIKFSHVHPRTCLPVLSNRSILCADV